MCEFYVLNFTKNLRKVFFISTLLPLISIGQVTPYVDEIRDYNTLSKEQLLLKSTILSLIIPSAGQIHNHTIKPNNIKSKLSWKLPVIYGVFFPAGYFTYINQNGYKNASTERINRQNGAAPNLYAFYSSSQLKIIEDQYKRNRNLSLISLMGVYLFQVIDAYVEANRFLFNSSDNLSLRMEVINTNGANEIYTPSLTLKYMFDKKKLNYPACNSSLLDCTLQY